jgi:DNA-binding SARP family transcriptional activator
MGKLHVQLFGTTTVFLPDGTAVTDLGGIKPRQIFEMLAMSPGTPVAKDRLADLLWNGEPPKSYIGTLESYVSLIRRRLGIARGRQSAIATTSNGYVLNRAHVEVDVDEFRRLAQPTARTSPATALARAERAVALVTGDLLASEAYADWAVHERTLFQSEYLVVCRLAAENALLIGHAEAAVAMARRAVRCDRVSETSWQTLIRSLSAAGARNEALRAYLELRRVLVNELGSEPGPVSRELYRDLLEDDRGESEAPASTSDVKTLLRLLRHALESFPGVDLPREDSRLAEVAVQVVGAA